MLLCLGCALALSADAKSGVESRAEEVCTCSCGCACDHTCACVCACLGPKLTRSGRGASENRAQSVGRGLALGGRGKDSVWAYGPGRSDLFFLATRRAGEVRPGLVTSGVGNGLVSGVTRMRVRSSTVSVRGKGNTLSTRHEPCGEHGFERVELMAASRLAREHRGGRTGRREREDEPAEPGRVCVPARLLRARD